MVGWRPRRARRGGVPRHRRKEKEEREGEIARGGKDVVETLLDVWKGVGRGSEKLMVVVREQEAMDGQGQGEV